MSVTKLTFQNLTNSDLQMFDSNLQGPICTRQGSMSENIHFSILPTTCFLSLPTSKVSNPTMRYTQLF